MKTSFFRPLLYTYNLQGCGENYEVVDTNKVSFSWNNSQGCGIKNEVVDKNPRSRFSWNNSFGCGTKNE